MNLEEQSTKLMRELQQLENEKNILKNKFFQSVFESLKGEDISKILSENYLPRDTCKKENNLYEIKLGDFLNYGGFMPCSHESESLNKRYGNSRDSRVGSNDKFFFRAIDANLNKSNVFFYRESTNTRAYLYDYPEDKGLYDLEDRDVRILKIAEAQISESYSEDFILNQARRFFDDFDGRETKIKFDLIFQIKTEVTNTKYVDHHRTDIFSPKKESLKVFGIEYPFHGLSKFTEYLIRGLDYPVKINDNSTKSNSIEQK
ncbi:MAG: hypothetical protein ACOYT4_00445 [Nanoarchaeota archaeon]